MEKTTETSQLRRTHVWASAHCVEDDCELSHNVFDTSDGGWVNLGANMAISVDTAALANAIADHFIELASAIQLKTSRQRAEAIADATSKVRSA